MTWQKGYLKPRHDVGNIQHAYTTLTTGVNYSGSWLGTTHNTKNAASSSRKMISYEQSSVPSFCAFHLWKALQAAFQEHTLTLLKRPAVTGLLRSMGSSIASCELDVPVHPQAATFLRSGGVARSSARAPCSSGVSSLHSGVNETYINWANLSLNAHCSADDTTKARNKGTQLCLVGVICMPRTRFIQ
jgi:hypothetical protein